MSSLHSLYFERCAEPSDIWQHLPFLSAFAGRCKHVTEFGVRTGNSTIAFLKGLGDSRSPHPKLVSYDIDPCEDTRAKIKAAMEATNDRHPFEERTWEFHQADTSQLRGIEITDLLFIDTLHTYAQVKAELRVAYCVERYIAFHDTTLFGNRDEFTPGPGINRAIFEFMLANPQWEIEESFRHNNGLLVLSNHSGATQ